MIFNSTETVVESPPLPKLQEGQRLDAEEFHRRYEAMPELKKAELIRGVVYMPSPLRSESHSFPHCDLTIWVGNYRVATLGLASGIAGTVRLSDQDEPQPDLALMRRISASGESRIDQDDYIAGPPEWVAEVSASTVALDRGSKFKMYEATGVQEYLLWRIKDQTVDWWHSVDGLFKPLPKEDGVIRSVVFPGLWLNVEALLAGDMQRVLEVLQQGLASPEHKAFVEQLAK